MAPHSSILARKIPWMEEPGRLQSMGSLRVRHDWVTSLSLSTFKHWRRKWQPTPVFLPGESHGRRSLVGCSRWGLEGWTWLSDFTFTFHFQALEKEMATHSSVLAWRIPGMGKPGWLLSMGLHRVRHDWSNLAVAADLQSSFSNVCKYQSVGGTPETNILFMSTIFQFKKRDRGDIFSSTGTKEWSCQDIEGRWLSTGQE